MIPSIPRGTRDFSPAEISCRNFIISTVADVFRLSGYQPIETPAMENTETLTGKYGEEGDRLIFRVLNSGDFLKDADREKLNAADAAALLPSISGKALRYDLTVPFARYVVMHRNDITFPFRRYQMQPVWRADRPQKGRYREFWQCDADIIGTSSLLSEAELIGMVDDVFSRLGMEVVIKINNRKILSGIAASLGVKEKSFTAFVTALDKIEKTGYENAVKEMIERNIFSRPVKENELTEFLREMPQRSPDKIRELSPEAAKGVEEIETIYSFFEGDKMKSSTVLRDYTLARGLDYYTGTIIEVKPAAHTSGSSICGGGRYDDLTGIFGVPGLPGVGISFGIDRIYDVMKEMNLFERKGLQVPVSRLMFAHFGEAERKYAFRLSSEIRGAGISAEVYPDICKIKKQMEYAGKKGIPFVAVIGEDEMKSGMITLREMSTGEQCKLPPGDLSVKLKGEKH